MSDDANQMRAAHFAHFCELMPELVARLSWSREGIEAHRTRALRELLGHAKRHAPWHAARLAHLDPERATIEDLASIPPMTKSDLMHNWDAIVTVPGASLKVAEEAVRNMRDQFYIWGNHTLFASGGTGGRPGLFVNDWTSLAMNWGGMSRTIRPYLASLPLPGGGIPHNYRTVAVGAEMSGHGSFVVGRVFSNPANPTRMLSGWRSVAELIPKLNAAQPQLLSCYPNLIPALAAAARSGELKIDPLAIVCGGEHFPDHSQRLARETWPEAAIMTCWGTSEGGGTHPCVSGDGFHVSEDQVIIEPVDETGAPTMPGQRSAGIYFTNLYNRAQPIIRYHIDDVFEMDDEPCACGSLHRKIRQVHGRAFEKFHYGTIIVHPVTLQLAVLEQPSILEYQIRQTKRGAHLAYRGEGDIDGARLAAKMRQALKSYGVVEPEVTVECVAQLGRTSVGKLKRFIPLPPTS